MPSENALGLLSPDERDFVSTLPATDRESLRRLAPMLRPSFASVQERDAAYTGLGLSDAPTCVIPSEGAEYKWDGRQWLAYDLRPKSFDPGWFSGSDLQRLTNTGGSSIGWYIRRGHTYEWQIVFTRGTTAAGANVGSGYYSWLLPFPSWSYNSTGTGYVRNGPAGSMEVDGSVVMRDSTHVSLLSGASRIGTASFETIADGFTAVLSGVHRLGGLL